MELNAIVCRVEKSKWVREFICPITTNTNNLVNQWELKQGTRNRQKAHEKPTSFPGSLSPLPPLVAGKKLMKAKLWLVDMIDIIIDKQILLWYYIIDKQCVYFGAYVIRLPRSIMNRNCE